MTYFQPHDAGIDSTPEQAAWRIQKLLNALDEVNPNIGEGDLNHEVAMFRQQVIAGLKAEGWSISYNDDRESYFVFAPEE